MKKLTAITAALTIAGVFCVATAYFASFYYYRYWMSVTSLEKTITDFDIRLAKLETRKSRELTPLRVSGIISTTDQAPDAEMLSSNYFTPSTSVPFATFASKAGAFVHPELRIPNGSTNEHEFIIQIDKKFGVVTDAWLSQSGSFSNLAAFYRLAAYDPSRSKRSGSNTVILFAQLKPNASAKLEFSIVVLCEK